MKFTINIETSEPMDIKRIADALTGSTATVTTGNAKPAAKTAVAASSDTGNAASTGQAATTDASPSETAAAVPSEKQIMDAANGAVAKLGTGGQLKVKNWIATNFQQENGTPAGLKSVKDAQKADLVAKMNQITTGTLSI